MNYVGFSATNSLLSRVIRWVTRSRVSHTFIITELYGQPWIITAEINGIIIVPAKTFQVQNTIKAIYRVSKLTNEQLSSTMSRLNEKYAYDFTGLFGSIFPQIGKRIKQKWKNPWNSANAMFCSEFVLTALQDCNYPGSDALIASETTPQDILDLITKRGKM